jgi:hypothetical protein
LSELNYNFLVMTNKNCLSFAIVTKSKVLIILKCQLATADSTTKITFKCSNARICKLCNGIQDREHLRNCSILQDKLSDIDNFENMTKTEKESVCCWLARSMMA